MIPSVEQQLRSVRRTLAATVLPAIDSSDTFAVEQAGLIVATLDRVLDVQASEYRYDLAEWQDAHELADALDGLEARGGSDASTPAADALASDTVTGSAVSAPPPADLDELRAATLAAKRRGELRFRALLTGEHADAARALMGRAGRRATERELAAARMTGFPRQVGSIAEVLERQATGPGIVPDPAGTGVPR